MKRVTAFTWGYWGWGHAAPEFVRAADALERKRGFKPPVFADVRLSRSVRAPAFRDRAFEQAMGPKRYVWIPKLGNKRFRTGGLELQDEAGARDLLDVIVSASKESKRVIFFCACESPIAVDGCHRYLARDALLREAKRARVPLTVQEWPGSSPSGEVDLVVEPDEACADALDRKRDWIPLPATVKVADLAGLPYGALARFETGGEPVHVLSGQVLFRKGRWHLRRLDDPATGPEGLIAAAPAHRRGLELQAKSVVRDRLSRAGADAP
jgi:hypothetical protein